MARFIDEMNKCKKDMEKFMPLAEKELAELTAQYKDALASCQQLEGDVREKMRRLSHAITSIEGKLAGLQGIIELCSPLMKDFDKIYSQGNEAATYLEEMLNNYGAADAACEAKGLDKSELSERQKKAEVAKKAYEKALRSHTYIVEKFNLLAMTWRTQGVVFDKIQKDEWAKELKVLTEAMITVGSAMAAAERLAGRFH